MPSPSQSTSVYLEVAWPHQPLGRVHFGFGWFLHLPLGQVSLQVEEDILKPVLPFPSTQKGSLMPSPSQSTSLYLESAWLHHPRGREHFGAGWPAHLPLGQVSLHKAEDILKPVFPWPSTQYGSLMPSPSQSTSLYLEVAPVHHPLGLEHFGLGWFLHLPLGQVSLHREDDILKPVRPAPSMQ